MPRGAVGPGLSPEPRGFSPNSFPAKALASAAKAQNEKKYVGRFLDCVIQTSMVLYESIENIGRVFDLIQVEYNDGTFSVAEAHDSVTMLLGELRQLSTFIEKMGGDGQVETILDLEQTMKPHTDELAQALAQSAIKTRVTKKK